MIRVDFGEVLLPGGERRPAATFWIGYTIDGLSDEWRVGLAWGRATRSSSRWEPRFPYRRRVALPLPRRLGECLFCRMKMALIGRLPRRARQ